MGTRRNLVTEKQRKLAQLIAENANLDKPLNKGEMLEKVGYSENTAKAKSHDIIESDGVQQALEEMGFTENNAKMVVSEIMLNPEIDPNARLRATDQVFKVKGSYAQDPNGGNKTLILITSPESAKRFNLDVDTTRNTEDSRS